MNRRDMITASLAAMAVPILPKVEYLRSMKIAWFEGATKSEFADLAGSWCRKHMDEGIMYMTSEVFDMQIKLEDPAFTVRPGRPLWSWMTGDMDRDGLTIDIWEKGIPISQTFVATSINYEEYWGEPMPADMPLYHVRRPHLTYERWKEIEDFLPKGHIDYDMRWLETLAKQRKERAA